MELERSQTYRTSIEIKLASSKKSVKIGDRDDELRNGK